MTTTVFLVLWAPRAAPYPVHVLVALAGVLGEVDPRPEHTADVGVSLVEPFLRDRLEKTMTSQWVFTKTGDYSLMTVD